MKFTFNFTIVTKNYPLFPQWDLSSPISTSLVEQKYPKNLHTDILICKSPITCYAGQSSKQVLLCFIQVVMTYSIANSELMLIALTDLPVAAEA